MQGRKRARHDANTSDSVNFLNILMIRRLWSQRQGTYARVGNRAAHASCHWQEAPHARSRRGVECIRAGAKSILYMSERTQHLTPSPDPPHACSPRGSDFW
jgi:hypothetical protein